jgi:hypothetical protein
MSTTPERAQEVDTKLAALWDQASAASFHEGREIESLHWMLGEKRNWKTWPTTPAQVEAAARAKLAEALDAPIGFPWSMETTNGSKIVLAHKGQALQRALAAIDAARVDHAAAREAAKPFEAEYEAERWPRFFLVVNHGGHVHRSMHCQTTFPTTQWAWLPSLSGLDEAAAVADQGPRLCSVCYPSAPVEWTMGLPKAPRCPGSGQAGQRIGRSRYGRCPVCLETFALSNVGAIRAHKPKVTK